MYVLKINIFFKFSLYRWLGRFYIFYLKENGASELNVSMLFFSCVTFEVFGIWSQFYCHFEYRVLSCTEYSVRIHAMQFMLILRIRPNYTLYQWYSTYGTRVICDTLTKKLWHCLYFFIFTWQMFRKWHPGQSNAKYTCQAISPVYYVQSNT